MRDELDYILGSEEPIKPSAQFALAVMRAVRQEAIAPPPIPFPWKRLAIGAAGVGALAVGITLLPSFSGGIGTQIEDTLNNSGAFWLAAGGLVSYLSVKLSLLSTA